MNWRHSWRLLHQGKELAVRSLYTPNQNLTKCTDTQFNTRLWEIWKKGHEELQQMDKGKSRPVELVLKNVGKGAGEWVPAKFLVFSLSVFQQQFSKIGRQRVTSQGWNWRTKTSSYKWSDAKIRMMSHFTHPHLAQEQGPLERHPPQPREIKQVHIQLLAKIIVLLVSTRECSKTRPQDMKWFVNKAPQRQRSLWEVMKI